MYIHTLTYVHTHTHTHGHTHTDAQTYMKQTMETGNEIHAELYCSDRSFRHIFHRYLMNEKLYN